MHYFHLQDIENCQIHRSGVQNNDCYQLVWKGNKGYSMYIKFQSCKRNGCLFTITYCIVIFLRGQSSWYILTKMKNHDACYTLLNMCFCLPSDGLHLYVERAVFFVSFSIWFSCLLSGNMYFKSYCEEPYFPPLLTWAIFCILWQLFSWKIK